MKSVYISGKISGRDFKEAFESFQKAEKKLIDAGYKVINPMKIPHNHDLRWESYMKTDIKALMDCDLIIMLDGWEESDGAKIEKDLAQKLSIKEMTLPNI